MNTVLAGTFGTVPTVGTYGTVPTVPTVVSKVQWDKPGSNSLILTAAPIRYPCKPDFALRSFAGAHFPFLQFDLISSSQRSRLKFIDPRPPLKLLALTEETNHADGISEIWCIWCGVGSSTCVLPRKSRVDVAMRRAPMHGRALPLPGPSI